MADYPKTVKVTSKQSRDVQRLPKYLGKPKSNIHDSARLSTVTGDHNVDEDNTSSNRSNELRNEHQDDAVKSVKEQPKKRSAPASVSEYLLAFYDGKVKSLNHTQLNKIKHTIQVDPQSRDDILTKAFENDPQLDKTLQLILLARDLEGNIGVENILRQIATEVTRHICAKRNIMISGWFFNEDGTESSIDSLCSSAVELHSKLSEMTLSPSDKKSGLKCVENAFYIACQWRLDQHKVTASSLVQAISDSFIGTNAEHSDIGSSLIRVLSLLPFNNSPGLNWLLEQPHKIQLQQRTTLIKAEKEIEYLKSKSDELFTQIEKNKSELETKDEEIFALKTELKNKSEQSRIKAIHLSDDHNRLHGKTLRLLEHEVTVLSDILLALNREPPKITVAKSYINDVIDRLTSEAKSLKE